MCCCSAGQGALTFLLLCLRSPAASGHMACGARTALASRPTGLQHALCVCSSALCAAGHHAALDVFETIVAPAAQRFQPDIILVSAGWVGGGAAGYAFNPCSC